MLKKYPKLRYPDHKKSSGLLKEGEVIVQEKVDGANIRFARECHLDKQFHTDDREIVFGSRNVAFKNVKDENKQFSHAIKYVRENISVEDIESIEETLDSPVTIFGEAMHPHTLEYNFNNIPSFVGFDIWDHERHAFVPPKDAKHFIEQTLGLDFSPILDTVLVEEWGDYSVQVPQSAYGNVRAEGVVLKNPTTNVWSKMVRENFKEKNKKTFGKSKKQQESGAEKLSYRYIPNARIRKQVHKLIDEGPWNSMQMEMMEPQQNCDGLPQAVIRDMVQEEGENIFLGESWEINIGEFRSTTSSRCAKILRKMINEKHFE